MRYINLYESITSVKYKFKYDTIPYNTVKMKLKKYSLILGEALARHRRYIFGVFRMGPAHRFDSF